MTGRVLPRDGFLYPEMGEKAVAIIKADRARRNPHEQREKCAQKSHIVNQFAACIHFPSQAAFGEFPAELGGLSGNIL